MRAVVLLRSVLKRRTAIRGHINNTSIASVAAGEVLSIRRGQGALCFVDPVAVEVVRSADSRARALVDVRLLVHAKIRSYTEGLTPWYHFVINLDCQAVVTCLTDLLS